MTTLCIDVIAVVVIPEHRCTPSSLLAWRRVQFKFLPFSCGTMTTATTTRRYVHIRLCRLTHFDHFSCDDDNDDGAELLRSRFVLSTCPFSRKYSSAVVVTKATTTETASNVDGVERQRLMLAAAKAVVSLVTVLTTMALSKSL